MSAAEATVMVTVDARTKVPFATVEVPVETETEAPAGGVPGRVAVSVSTPEVIGDRIAAGP